MARASTTWTKKTAYRGGGKTGRVSRNVLLRKNIELKASAKGVDVKTFMLGVVGDDSLPLELRQVAARDVAKYTHRALAPEAAPPPAAPAAAQVLIYIPSNNRDERKKK